MLREKMKRQLEASRPASSRCSLRLCCGQTEFTGNLKGRYVGVMVEVEESRDVEEWPV